MLAGGRSREILNSGQLCCKKVTTDRRVAAELLGLRFSTTTIEKLGVVSATRFPKRRLLREVGEKRLTFSAAVEPPFCASTE